MSCIKCRTLVGEDGFEPSKLKSNRFTVCPLWPLGNSPLTISDIYRLLPIKWSWWTDSNPRPADYKSAALPTELHQLNWLIYYTTSFSICQPLFWNFFKKFFRLIFVVIGRGDRTRTCGILVPNQALYQTELRLVFFILSFIPWRQIGRASCRERVC